MLNFQGCVLIVTHDRYFMDRLVDHVFVMEGEGKIRDYPGNYTDYRLWRDSESRSAQPKQSAASQNDKPALPASKNQSPTAPVTNAPDPKKKLSFREIREYETLEPEIAVLEQQKEDTVARLNGGGHHEDLIAWAQQIEELDQLIAQKTDRWLELAELV